MTAWSACSIEINNLAAGLVKATGELKDVVKSRRAEVGQYSYNYADLATVLAMARPVLAKHGLVVTQTAETDDAMVIVWTTILHESGQYVTLAPTRLAAGKTPQQTGSALSYARRYALMAALNLASEDDDGLEASARTASGNATAKVRPARRTAPNAVLGEPRTEAEDKARAFFAALSPDFRKDAKQKFVALFGCPLSELPVEEHPRALAFLYHLGENEYNTAQDEKESA